jgi:Ni/Fe-hydrogenase 1 B-type cytochrome subunit
MIAKLKQETAVSVHRIRAPIQTPKPALERVYVWDLVVRITHWVIALSIVVLSVSGIYIGRPFLIVPGEAGDHFVMGTMKVLHFYFAIAFSLAVFARLAWMLVGSEHARWTSFVPTTRERWRDLFGTLKFYFFLKLKPPECAGHNPVAGAAYLAIFGLYLVMIATGLGLYAVDAGVSIASGLGFLLWPFGGAQGARWVHHVVMWLLIGFTIQHVYSGILVSLVEKNGAIDSIVSGFKWLRRKG